MTNTHSVTASELEIGDMVRVPSRLAIYHGRPELIGQVRQVIGITTWSGSAVLGIELEGLPETGIGCSAHVIVEGE